MRSPDVSPLIQTSWRDRLQNVMRPVSSVWRSVAGFMYPIMRTSLVPCSCTIAATSPAASYFTVASSSSDAAMGVPTGDMAQTLQIQPRAPRLQSRRRHGVDVALAQDDVVVAPHLDL